MTRTGYKQVLQHVKQQLNVLLSTARKRKTDRIGRLLTPVLEMLNMTICQVSGVNHTVLKAVIKVSCNILCILSRYQTMLNITGFYISTMFLPKKKPTMAFIKCHVKFCSFLTAVK